MKGFAVLFLAIFAVISGLPQPETEIKTIQNRLVSDTIASILENVSDQIRESGLDPWSFPTFLTEYELPVPVLFSGSAYIRNILFTGLSNIVINHMHYGLLTSRLTFDVSLPEVALSLGGAGFDITALGSRFTGNIGGRLAIIEPRIKGVVQMNVGIISGLFVRDMDLEFEMDDIRFNGEVNLMDTPLTDFVTDFVTNKIPTAIREHREEINQLVEIVAWDIVAQIR